MNQRFESRVALVTGGGSGIGAAAARLFAREGARVMIADLSGKRAEAVAASIADAGAGTAEWLKGDVAAPDFVASAIDKTVSAFGSLDVVFNNAGLADPGPIESTTVESWDRVQAVTLTSVFLGIKHSIPVMRKQGGGVIVNTASIDGLFGSRNMASYCAAKSGVVNLTRQAAVELAEYGIRVNCVCPGSINTRSAKVLAEGREAEYYALVGGASPMMRIGEPEEVADVVAFLASDAATFITGSALTIDGGLTADTHLPGLPDS